MALELYLRFWVFIKVYLAISFVVLIYMISSVSEYEYCVHHLFSSIYVSYVTSGFMDIIYTIFVVIGITKGIIDTNDMDPYKKYLNVLIYLLFVIFIVSLIALIPFFRWVCPYLRVGSWYLFSYSTVYHLLLMFVFIWLTVNAYAAWKIIRYRKRKDHLIEKVGCIFITRQTITDTEGVESSNDPSEIDNDVASVNIIIPPNIQQ